MVRKGLRAHTAHQSHCTAHPHAQTPGVSTVVQMPVLLGSIYHLMCFKRFLFHITICLTKSRWNDKNISLCFAFCEIMLLILPMLVLFNVLRDSEQKKGGMSGKSKFFCLLCCLGMKTVNGMDQIIYSWLSVHYFTHNRKVRHDSSS